MKSKVHSIQIPVEIHQDLINYLTVAAQTDPKAKESLKILHNHSNKIMQCCRCLEAADEETDGGYFYCHSHWWDAVNEDNPAPGRY